ncbi:MAG: OadG family protein [Clostridiales bacterium]|nr:OadG family protein [Clostridiales bacterium]
MLNNLMAIIQGDGSYWAGQQKSPDNFYFDNFGEAALYALIGFLVVFVGIIIIIGIIWLVGLIMRKTNNLEFLTKKREKKAKTEAVEKAPAVSSAQDDDIPDEVKAAIVAAIMAYYQEREEKCEFTVKRIKRL